MAGRECCDCEEGCTNCFGNGKVGSLCCRLNREDRLILRIERPAWTKLSAAVVNGVPGGSCPCVGTNIITGQTNYNKANDLIVGYAHHVVSKSRPDVDEDYVWFADNGSFGCNGGTNYTDLWKLWPPLCYQETGPAGATSGNIAFCCSSNCDCSVLSQPVSTPRIKIGPADRLSPIKNWVCTNSNSAEPDNVNLTNVQVGAIEGTLGGRTHYQYNCPAGSPNPGPVSMTTNCDYAQYGWLKGIYDDSSNSQSSYKHYYWDPLTNSVAYGGLKPLAHTLVSVFHREKWFKACEKVDAPTSECDKVGNWGCRAPEYWAYGCAGVPIFSWEIREMLDAQKITQGEYEAFFRIQYENEPLGGDASGYSCLKKLESTHYQYPDGSGISLLQTRDWRGFALPNTSPPAIVPNTEDRLIRKDLVRYVRGNRIVVPHQFFEARSGGWTHICRSPPRSCSSDCSTGLYVADEIDQLAPQIPRELGCTGTAAPCTETTWSGQGPTGEATIQNTTSCFSASPFPQCGTCTDVQTCGSCTICNSSGCSGCGLLTLACGDNVVKCGQETYSADCNGIHFTHATYYNDQGSNTNNPEERCLLLNHAYLQVMRSGCNPTDEELPHAESCERVLSCEGPEYDRGAPERHLLSFIASRQSNCGEVSSSNFCSSASKTVRSGTQTNLQAICRGPGATQPDSSKNSSESMQDLSILSTNNCGRYVCNNTNFPVGACCITSPSGTECIDYLTEEQCEACGNQSPNTQSVWHGVNSCCQATPPLC